MRASVAAAAVEPSSAARLYGQGRSRKASLLHSCHLKTGLRCGRGAFNPSSPRFPLFLCQRRPDHNVNGGDTDEMFDELFQKYGKVVYSDSDRKRPTAEADDDAESLSFAVALAKVANEVKAADIRVLFVKPLVYWTRFFIIVTAFSRPQVDAIGSRIRDIAEKQFNKNAAGDTKPNSWTLLDFGDVVVHIFLPQQRAFYNLEEFYGNATPIELPFDTQSPFRK
ncbi:protein Iojap, chloroplastic isoform X2 [Ananas comosus]|uniref:Protein Iojap, chloroplastic n=1 Tax=Ananas comosus TaxID=4615 RepID=A0A6P5F4R1_ANACO|nr:protein Iojap, chloroplastic isoform X2 [Ananas comosus]